MLKKRQKKSLVNINKGTRLSLMSVAKNYIYNVIYQLVILIIPLVTVPYISRVLGSNGVGTNAYTNSIIQYFILFGTIGITLYGTRAIAYVRDDKEKLSRCFWGIFFLKLVTTFLAYAVFLLFLKLTKSYHAIFLIQSIYIIAAAADISWLYMGLEDFKKTVFRNLWVRIIGVVLIFVFVKNTDDLWKYVLILAASQLFGQLTMWMYLPKTVKWLKNLSWKDTYRHLFPSISLFIPQVAIQIYIVLNKTMLGYFSNTNEVGFFDSSDKIVKIILSVVTAMGVVMMPRVANTFAKGEIVKVREYLYSSFDFVSYLSVPMMFGIAGIASTFTPWFFGPGFEKTGAIIVIISPIIVFIAWSNVLGQQYLMPIGQIRAYTISVSVGALVNFLLNLILIRYYQSIGTAFATVIAELTVMFVQLCYVIRVVKFIPLFKSLWKYIFAGALMYGVIRFIGAYSPNKFLITCLQIIIGMVIYFGCLFLLKSSTNKKLYVRIFKLLHE